MTAHAVVVKVNAEYSQSISRPGENEFRITDPCTSLPLPFFCDDNVSRVVAIDADIDKPIFNGLSWRVWERFFHHAFPKEKTIQLVNEAGSVLNMNFMFTHTGYTLHDFNVDIGDAYQVDSSSQCRLVGSNISQGIKTVFYSINENAQKSGGSCYSKLYPHFIFPTTGYIKKIYFGYRLVPTNIGAIANGRYQGKLTLTVGSAKDMDYTDSIYRSPSVIDIELSLVVRNQMKVQFPAAASRVTLSPPKGWHDTKSEKGLLASLPVRISSDSPFWIGLICQYKSASNDQCEIRNEQGQHAVPLTISRQTNSGRFVLSPSSKTFFKESNGSIYDSFVFEVNRQNTNEMLKRPGAKYKGMVTLVLDAKMPIGAG
ncbi:hypothetical protein NRZ29_04855 [Aeromonas hydrophila]|uniref:hypothetical protein n=1 Tax=Aeromonas hydrophila TaxID=644 RepID=UPI00227D700C|nr:hypothetical protein [Aeromonas hydrophila]WAG16527.1 hypothetical protein NRZ29_04855 [Aeromonas hydrophila]